MDEQFEQAKQFVRGESGVLPDGRSKPVAPPQSRLRKFLDTLVTIRSVSSRILFMRSNRRKLHELLGVVGTCATLRYPKSPPWVRVERDTPGHLILTNNETLVPQLLPESEAESRRYLHRLVAAEAARREADHIHCRAPKTADWKRLADAYLAQFRGVKESSALAREVLFEEMTRDVCLRFYIMGRRLRKARQRLFDTGKLTNNDLQELWMTYEQFDIEAHAGIDDEDLPERLRLHPSEPTRA